MHETIYRYLEQDIKQGENEIKNPYKWSTHKIPLYDPTRILIIEMLVFLYHCFHCYKSTKRYQEKSQQRKNEGTLFKIRLTRQMGYGSLGCLIAFKCTDFSIARSFSIILMVLIHSPNESPGILSLEYFFITFPSLLWMPSYFSMIIFFAKINHLITGKSHTFLQPLLNGLFWCSVIIYAWFCTRGLTRGGNEDFIFETTWLIGMLYIILAVGTLLYGQRIIWNIQNPETSDSGSRRTQSLKNVRILTYLCAVVFILRGVFNIFSVEEGQVTRKYLVETLHIWHGLSFLISELVPALAIAYLLKGESKRQETQENYELEVLLKNGQAEREKPLLTEI